MAYLNELLRAKMQSEGRQVSREEIRDFINANRPDQNREHVAEYIQSMSAKYANLTEDQLKRVAEYLQLARPQNLTEDQLMRILGTEIIGS